MENLFWMPTNKLVKIGIPSQTQKNNEFFRIPTTYKKKKSTHSTNNKNQTPKNLKLKTTKTDTHPNYEVHRGLLDVFLHQLATHLYLTQKYLQKILFF